MREIFSHRNGVDSTPYTVYFQTLVSLLTRSKTAQVKHNYMNPPDREYYSLVLKKTIEGKNVLYQIAYSGNISFIFLLLLIQSCLGLTWIQYPSSLIFFLCLSALLHRKRHLPFLVNTHSSKTEHMRTPAASHTHSHTSEICGTFTAQINLSSNSVVKKM